MVRSFKFRIWAKAFKPPRFINPNEMHCFNFQTWADILGKFNDSLFIFQQWTGLKDKNEREIYEGDIVKFSHLDFDKTVIAEFAWNNDRLRWVWTYPSIKYGIVELDLENYDLEVIGNILENKNLIDSKE